MNSILVIGGGLAGIQASLDLAEMGAKVYLLEKNPSIGGHMAQLDKTFPTNDCAMCILGPKMVEVERHKNIKLLTYSELEEVNKINCGFKAKIVRKPRYIDENKCAGCGACAEACILRGRIEDKYNVGLKKRGAVYLPFPQAVPFKYIVDGEECLYVTRGVCGKEPACVESCKARAIDFSQKPTVIEIEIGAIIVAIGFDVYNPSEISEYGYKRYINVITSLECERLISASGPTRGRVERPSDGETPDTIVFVQCVGSRNKKYNPYCCSICCMFATKQAVLIKEKKPKINVYILYTDLRASGKGSWQYINRAKDEYKVKYIRSKPGEIIEDSESKKLNVLYNVGKEVKNIEADLVVLTTALTPNKEAEELSEILGIEIDEYGFYKSKDFLRAPADTNIPGIFVCGFCNGPSNITESVLEASAAAARAIVWIRPL